MAIRRFVSVIILLVLMGTLKAQDTLPRFSAVSKGNGRAIISWVNTMPNVRQISIQRSNDSLRNFKSIMTVVDPELPQNGFADTKAQGLVFYRLFIVLDSGSYMFSKSKRPTIELQPAVTSNPEAPVNGSRQVQIAPTVDDKELKEIAEKTNTAPVAPVVPAAPVPKPEKYFVIVRNDSIINRVNEKLYKRFRDSVVTRSRDTILFRSADTIQIKPFVPKEVYKPSRYIFTEKDGNIAIVLPEAPAKKYHVKFYEDNMDFLFEIKQITEPYLVLEKSNFLHAGWFRFELFEDGKLKEKQKFFIARDF